MTTFHVRPAALADAGIVATLLGQLGYPTTEAEAVGRLERMFIEADAEALVATLDNRVVGLATLQVLRPMHRPRPVGQLTALVVADGARGHGVGRALVHAATDACRARGCERLTVTTHKHRDDAQQFYLRAGFEHTGVRYGMMLARDALPASGLVPPGA